MAPVKYRRDEMRAETLIALLATVSPGPKFCEKRKLFRGSLVAQWEDFVLQCRRHRFDAWSGKIPTRAEQLSLLAATTEHVL